MHRTFGREVAIIITKAIVVVATIVALLVVIETLYEYESSIGDGSCNVAVLPIEGVILPFYGLIDAPLVLTPEAVETFMDEAEGTEGIEAVLVEINSPGGTPVAAERIAKRFRSSYLPVVGLVGDIGASGGYLVAAATDHLVASPMSDVGGIGVTMSYVENSKQNEEDGLTFVELNTGKFKDAGSPDKPLTEEERALFQRDLDIVHDEFVRLVATYRNKSTADIKALADGATMTGVRALDVGLIDQLGGREEATNALAEILGRDPTDIIFCEYEPSFIPL